MIGVRNRFGSQPLHTTDTLSTVTVGTPLASIVVVMVVYRKAFWAPPLLMSLTTEVVVCEAGNCLAVQDSCLLSDAL
jgi:hypothetical protein